MVYFLFSASDHLPSEIHPAEIYYKLDRGSRNDNFLYDSQIWHEIKGLGLISLTRLIKLVEL